MRYFSHDNLNFYFDDYDSGVPFFSHTDWRETSIRSKN